MKQQTTWQFLTLLLITSALAACGGGGGSSGTSATTASPSSNTNLTPTTAASSVQQNIDYYGDSTVWGFASGSDGARIAVPPTQTFAEQLPAGARYVVRNEGVPRTTACQLLAGTDGIHPDWATQMSTSNARFVFINHAINDQRADIGEGVTAYRNCLTSLIRTARQRGKIVILETPNPTDQSGSGLEDYVAGMKAVAAAEGVNVIDQYQYLQGLLAGRDVRTLMPDGVHPSDSTYTLKGRFAASEFLKMAF